MVKLFYLFFLPILLFISFSCATKDNNLVIEKTYYKDGSIKRIIEKNKNNQLHGKLIEFFKNGDTLSLSNWVEGKREGNELTFYPGNKISTKVFIQNGKPNGKMFAYYKNGNIEMEGEYKDSILTNQLIAYYDSNIRLISSINNYINYRGIQKPMGWVEYDKNGNVKSEESRIKILTKNDTIKLGDSLVTNLYLIAPKYDSTLFFIGDFDEKFFIENSAKIDTFFVNNHQLRYPIRPLKRGVNYIRGGAKNYKVLSASNKKKEKIVRPELYFEYKFFVK